MLSWSNNFAPSVTGQSLGRETTRVAEKTIKTKWRIPFNKQTLKYRYRSDSGTFLGLGTVTGSVAIYIAFSLQKLYYVQESHGIVVTDLAFLPDTPKGQSLKGNNEAAMLSVAVDSRCQMHTVRNRRSFPIWLVLFFCGLMVVGAVLLLQHLFPGFI